MAPMVSSAWVELVELVETPAGGVIHSPVPGVVGMSVVGCGLKV
jgi:hypothetical protein